MMILNLIKIIPLNLKKNIEVLVGSDKKNKDVEMEKIKQLKKFLKRYQIRWIYYSKK